MTCVEIERDEIAERYLSGRLGEEASAEFEAHYFDCSRCQPALTGKRRDGIAQA